MPFLRFPLSPCFFPYWNGILSHFPVSIFFYWFRQTFFFIFKLVSYPAFFPPKSLMQAVHWGSPLCPKPASKKTLQWIPSKQNTCVTRFYTFMIQWSLSCPSHWLKPNSVPPYWSTHTLNFCIKSFPPLYFLSVFHSVSQTRAASLSPPPYVVILISCSGLVSFVLLLLTCLCCKRGGVGFNVSLQHVRDLFTSLCFLCFFTPFVHAGMLLM